MAVSGVVTQAREVKQKTSTYFVDYSFTTPDGVTHQSSHTVCKFDFSQIKPGQAVIVLHMEGRPSRNLVYEYGGYRLNLSGMPVTRE